jgi:hypothetical protein
MDKEGKSIVNEFIQVCHEIRQIFVSDEHVHLRRFLFDNIKRSMETLETFLILNQVNNTNKYEHSIGILLRTVLLDFITFSYFFNKSKNGVSLDLKLLEKSIENQIKSPLNRLAKDDKLVEAFKYFYQFDENGGVIKFKELPSVIGKVRPYAESTKDINFIRAIKSWEWYSKYEHYGLFSEVLASYDDNITRQNNSVFFIMVNIYYSFITFNELKVIGFDKDSFENKVLEIFDRYTDAINIESNITPFKSTN